MTARDANLNLKCDHIIPTVNDHFYEFPDGSPAGFLCDSCASDVGFCPGCGYFVLGSDDDRTLYSQGLCTGCMSELNDELGDGEDDIDDYGNTVYFGFDDD